MLTSINPNIEKNNRRCSYGASQDDGMTVGAGVPAATDEGVGAGFGVDWGRLNGDSDLKVTLDPDMLKRSRRWCYETIPSLPSELTAVFPMLSTSHDWRRPLRLLGRS